MGPNRISYNILDAVLMVVHLQILWEPFDTIVDGTILPVPITMHATGTKHIPAQYTDTIVVSKFYNAVALSVMAPGRILCREKGLPREQGWGIRPWHPNSMQVIHLLTVGCCSLCYPGACCWLLFQNHLGQRAGWRWTCGWCSVPWRRWFPTSWWTSSWFIRMLSEVNGHRR